MLLDAPPTRGIPPSPQPESKWGRGHTLWWGLYPTAPSSTPQPPTHPAVAQGTKQVPMDPGIRDRGLCQPLTYLTWLSKAHGLPSHAG